MIMKQKQVMKATYWIAVLLLVAMILGGCGGSQPTEQAPVPQETAAGAAESASAETASAQPATASGDTAGDRDTVISKLASMTMPTELSYDMVYSLEGYTMTTQIWMKGDKSRMDATNPSEGNYIMLEDGEYTYMLQPDEMTGIRMDLDDEDDYYEDDFDEDFMDADYDWGSMTFLGTDTINGMPTYVFQDDGDYENVKVWIHADYALPVRMEGETDDETYVMEITNLKVGGVADSVFKVPAGYDIMEMNW
ncbi:hypothetical protein [Anoxynatronum sibiricum]|uniref:DUF4412 domain-containing protein n=1 Tax=Anoxynatronum sibiricum TaxID=210623 RepID=A0ABU9VU50_9CLOT